MPLELLASCAMLPTHPDVRCAILADALVDAAVALDRRARCEVSVVWNDGTLLVGGQLPEGVPVHDVVRSHWGEVPQLLVRTHPENGGGHVVAQGHAVDEPGVNYLPAETWLAGHLAHRLAALESGSAGGELVVLLEADDHPTRLAGFSCGLTADARSGPLPRSVRAILQDELAQLARCVPGFDPRAPESIVIHPFVPPTFASNHRLNTFSGMDLAHPARAGAIAARRLAKAVVRAGVARECRVVLTHLPNQEEAVIVALHGDGRRLDAARWGDLVDRSITRIAGRYTGAVVLAEVARHGMFLREDWPWEGVRFES